MLRALFRFLHSNVWGNKIGRISKLHYLNSFFFYLVFTKEESNADMLVSEQVGVAAMAVVS